MSSSAPGNPTSITILARQLIRKENKARRTRTSSSRGFHAHSAVRKRSRPSAIASPSACVD
ncbi:MAG: hypothetical protein ACPIOQ_83750, partial [Promethearchaeia archaeon]